MFMPLDLVCAFPVSQELLDYVVCISIHRECNVYICICLHTPGMAISDEEAEQVQSWTDSREFFELLYDPY